MGKWHWRDSINGAIPIPHGSSINHKKDWGQLVNFLHWGYCFDFSQCFGTVGSVTGHKSAGQTRADKRAQINALRQKCADNYA